MPEADPANHYGQLKTGERFIFLYPHHSETVAAWLWQKTEFGHRRVDSNQVIGRASVQMAVQVVPEDIPYKDGLVRLEDLE